MIHAHHGKISRARDKVRGVTAWKVELKHGVARINGIEIVFGRCDCEFIWR